MQPVSYMGEVLLWVINYSDNNGFIILAADKTEFPIISFSNEGKFDMSDENNKAKIEELLLMLYEKKNYL